MPRTAIIGATLLDTSSARPHPTQRTLVIEDGRIAAWLKPDEPVEADVIDARGLWMLPGLIDLHVHPFRVDHNPAVPRQRDTLAREVNAALKALAAWLQSGVTTVRSVGVRENLDVELRELVRRGVIRGPRIFASGYLIAMTAGLQAGDEKVALEVTGPDRAREAARKQIKAGVDALALYTSSSVASSDGRLNGPPGWPQLNEDALRAVVEEADHAGLPTLAQATLPEAVKTCLRAGVHGIGHALGLDDEAIAMLAERNVPVVPALAIGRSLATAGAERGFGEQIARSADAQQPVTIASLKQAKAAGVRVAIGTDAEHSRCLVSEACRLLVEAGFTPYEALRAATIIAAEVLRAEAEIGSLKRGRHADLLLLEADPLQDIRNLAAVRGVLKGGEVVYWSETPSKVPTVAKSE